MASIGGAGRIRTYGAVTPDSFQDCCHKPLDHYSIKYKTLIYSGLGFEPKFLP